MKVELAQLLQEQEQFLSQQKQPSARLFRCKSGARVSASNSSEYALKSAREDDPQVLKGVIERHVTPMGQQNLIVDFKPSGFPLVKRRGCGQSLFGRRRREAAFKKQEQLQEPLDQESSDIDAFNNAALQEMSRQEIEEAQQELVRSLDPKLIEKLKNRRKKNDNKEMKESGEQSMNTEKKRMMIGSVVKYEKEVEAEKDQIQKEEKIKNLAAVKTEQELNQQVEFLPKEERAKLEWTQNTKERTRKIERGKEVARPGGRRCNA
ncbi:unnamed protein product [Peronospora destructor]|uniref:RPAP1 N-terminal domain-containing protein n=1 Tax=Peronospora destructor TaxID=86335 RepID=A0AAV0UWL8_9STRA|nr:unnamed protein product [Peronospora destructor]